MIPDRLSKVTKVKNFRYVLNQSLKRIHRLIFGGGRAGFFGDGSGGGASTGAFHPAGHDSDSAGTLEKGVRPS